MGKQAFEASMQAGGRHHALGRFTGTWQGTTRVWFEPDTVADEAPIHGSIRAVLDGRFLLHEYETTFMGERQVGIALYGWHIDRGCHEAAWVDSAHTGTQILTSAGTRGDERFAVLGHYGGHDGSEPWGWRTEIVLEADDRLVITAYNLMPGEPEARAVETVYTRVAD